MRLIRVRKDSTGQAGRLRWVLEAEFSVKHGFTPSFGERTNDAWDEAVVAVEGDRLVGALRWDHLTKEGRGLRAGGTWVAPEQRGSGLARTLWQRALRGQRVVEVTTISRGGKALIASLKKRYPRVSWVTNCD